MFDSKTLPDGRTIAVDAEGQPVLLDVAVGAYGDDEHALAGVMFTVPTTQEDIERGVRDMVETLISTMPERVAKEARERIGDDWSLGNLAEVIGTELPPIEDVELTAPVPYTSLDVGDGACLVYKMGLN